MYNYYTPARFEIKYKMLPSGVGKYIPAFIRNKLSFFIIGLIDKIQFEMTVIK
jgi:hypothetical protein